MRAKVSAHLETCRPYTLFYVGLVGLSGAVLSGGHPSALRLASAWGVPTVAWVAGLYIGDYFDRQLDAGAKPHRPIPSGRLRAATAVETMIGCVVGGATVAVLLNWRTSVLVLVALVMAMAYNRFFKARGVSGNLARGSLTAFALLFGAMLVAPYPSWRLLPVALMFWLHDAGTNLVGTLRDVEGDGNAGYRTLPVRYGFTRALQAVAMLGAGWLVLAAAAPTALGVLASAWYVALVAVAALMFATAFGFLVRAGQPIAPQVALRAHEILVVERIILAGAFVMAAAPKAWAVPVVLAALATTVVSQLLLRSRHEFGSAAVDGAANVVAPGMASGRNESLTSGEILGYVDDQLALLASGPPLGGLRGWNRTIDIQIVDLPLRLRVVAINGVLRRVPVEDASDAANVNLTTASEVFRDIFLLGRTNPRRALLARQIRAKAEPRDLLYLNQLFNEFRRRRPPAPLGDAERASPAPRAPGGRAEESPATGIAPSIVISDTTLRDGEQAPGVAFRPAAKIQLARCLAAVGVPLLEVGFPAVSDEEVEAIRGIVAADLDTVIQVIARPVERDIDMAVESGAHSIAVFVGTSDAHIERKLRTDRDGLLGTISHAVSYAKRSGRQIVFAAEDATRTDPEFLARAVMIAADAGADAIGLADTVGIATPWSMAELVGYVAAECPLPIAVHCHDDLGLATANSLAALRAGASGAQCSVLGIGERAGNASLEELVLALEIACGYRTGLDLTGLQPLADEVAALSGQSIMPGKAVVGRNAFLHESGLHTSGILRDPATYEPYPPELTGRARSFAAGKHSGRSGIQHILARHAVVLDDDHLEALLGRVKRRDYRGMPLDERELVRMARDALANRADCTAEGATI